jgi:hypothetical protein
MGRRAAADRRGDRERKEETLPPREGGEPAERRVLKIYTVVEKPSSPKGIWLEIGVATENRDGSLSGKLDCLPVSGSIQIRPWEPRRQENGEGSRFNQPPQRR